MNQKAPCRPPHSLSRRDPRGQRAGVFHDLAEVGALINICDEGWHVATLSLPGEVIAARRLSRVRSAVAGVDDGTVRGVCPYGENARGGQGLNESIHLLELLGRERRPRIRNGLGKRRPERLGQQARGAGGGVLLFIFCDHLPAREDGKHGDEHGQNERRRRETRMQIGRRGAQSISLHLAYLPISADFPRERRVGTGGEETTGKSGSSYSNGRPKLSRDATSPSGFRCFRPRPTEEAG
jgi:hypothetical protein